MLTLAASTDSASVASARKLSSAAASLAIMSRLVVISGLPGVGKTAVASLVASRLWATHLSVDAIEEGLLAAGLTPGWETGVAAYEAVRAAAELNLSGARDVVVDAVNDSEPARETWRGAARVCDAELTQVVLVCSDEAEHQTRLQERQRGFRHVPEPTWEEVVSRSYRTWSQDHLEIDTAGIGVGAVVELVLAEAETR